MQGVATQPLPAQMIELLAFANWTYQLFINETMHTNDFAFMSEVSIAHRGIIGATR
jgi:hypothetical protein